MTLLEEYKATFDNSEHWFAEEVNRSHHTARIANVISNRKYLSGQHKVLLREDAMYKGKVLMSSKTILQYAKTLLTFHDTLLLGKPVSVISNDEATAKAFTDIYKAGLYDSVDYHILDKVNKYGDAYEYIFVENGVIKSKVFDSADSYPVYTDSGEYIAFIEFYEDVYTNIAHWNVYYPSFVEYWTNENGTYILKDTKINLSGLPIHYHNISDEDDMFGVSVLNDLKPILDTLEDILAKMGDAIYVNTLNPLPVALGQRIENTIPADATGYVLNLDNGDYKVVSTTMDYNTIKLYLDNMKNMLDDIACFPTALSGNTNIANVSSVSLQMLFHMAIGKAYENEKWLDKGFRERFNKMKDILAMQGIDVNGDVAVEYNIAIPVATDEVVNNLKTMREIGAISIDTVMEKSDLIKDVAVEKERLAAEPKLVNDDLS